MRKIITNIKDPNEIVGLLQCRDYDVSLSNVIIETVEDEEKIIKFFSTKWDKDVFVIVGKEQ